MAIAVISSNFIQGYMTSLDLTSYANANIDGGLEPYDSITSTNNVLVGQWANATTAYSITQGVVQFNLSTLPAGQVNSVILTAYSSSTMDADEAYTVEVRSHAAITPVACSSSCVPMEGFYQGANIVTNTSPLLASLSSASFVAENLQNTFTSETDFIDYIIPGTMLYLHLSTNTNRIETIPASDTSSRCRLYNYSTYPMELTIDYTPYSQVELGINF